MTPNRWREEPYYSTIKQFALQGLRGVNGTRSQTVVTVKGVRTLVFPHREFAHTHGIVAQLGEDKFEFLPCESDDAVKRELAGLYAIADAREAAVERLREKGIHPPKDPVALIQFLAREDPEFVAAAKAIGESDKNAARSSR
jgi:hypothetical protein